MAVNGILTERYLLLWFRDFGEISASRDFDDINASRDFDVVEQVETLTILVQVGTLTILVQVGQTRLVKSANTRIQTLVLDFLEHYSRGQFESFVLELGD